MTGYSRGEATSDSFRVTIDARSLNNRYLDINIKLPRSYAFLEQDILNITKDKLSRGKIEIVVDIQHLKKTKNLKSLNEDAVRHYVKIYEKIHEIMQGKLTHTFASLQDPNAFGMLELEGVLENSNSSAQESEEEELKTLTEKAINGALSDLIKSRNKEGLKLKSALIELASDMQKNCKSLESDITELRAEIFANYQSRLTKVMESLEASDLKGKLPPEERMIAEVTALTEKSDIEEEITRLNTHLAHFMEAMELPEPVGRKLDFLCQELHRESNTILSKVQNPKAKDIGLNLKHTTEKIRQQVQNIE